MKRKLVWVDVLNEQTRWGSRTDFCNWFDQLVGRKTNLLDGTIEGFVESLGFMRRSVAHLHFGEPIDLMWLDTQLKTVTLGLLHHQGAQEGEDSQMSRFRARTKGMIDSDLLRAVKDSLLVQFAEYVGDTLDGTASHVVSRCEGTYRRSTVDTCVSSGYTPEMDATWRDEIPLLARSTPATVDIERCTNLFAGNPKTRFCGDACRFATLQIAKSVQEPGDLTAKQRRRRRAEKQAE
jgi:hypothetical protein